MARNPTACKKYCKKEDTRVDGQGPYEFGEEKKHGGDRKSVKFSYRDLELNIITN